MGLALVVIAFAFRDYLTPESPQKRARIISDLSVPTDARLEAEDSRESAPFGGAVFQMRLRVEPKAFDRLVQEAKAKGYRPLPMGQRVAYTGLERYSLPSASGWYREWGDSDHIGFGLVILDAVTHTISMLRVIN
jgi:hypothetical protein